MNYANGRMATNHSDTKAWLAHLEQLVEEYRADQQRHDLRQIEKVRRLAEIDRARAASEETPRED